MTSLNGRVDTSMVALGLSSRPLPKLSLAADWRLEERDDKTPLARYNVEGGTAYTNRNYSQTRVRGKASATYQLPQQLLGTLGAVGAAGIPGAGLIMMALVFGAVDVPLETIAFVAGVDRIMDMMRTTTNVTGDAAVTGKAVGKDAAAGKATFVSLLGLEPAKVRAKTLIDEAEAALSGYGPAAQNLIDCARFVIAREN